LDQSQLTLNQSIKLIEDSEIVSIIILLIFNYGCGPLDAMNASKHSIDQSGSLLRFLK